MKILSNSALTVIEAAIDSYLLFKSDLKVFQIDLDDPEKLRIVRSALIDYLFDLIFENSIDSLYEIESTVSLPDDPQKKLALLDEEFSSCFFSSLEKSCKADTCGVISKEQAEQWLKLFVIRNKTTFSRSTFISSLIN